MSVLLMWIVVLIISMDYVHLFIVMLEVYSPLTNYGICCISFSFIGSQCLNLLSGISI